MFCLCFAHVSLFFTRKRFGNRPRRLVFETSPLCRENHEEHEFDNENRQGGPKRSKFALPATENQRINPCLFPLLTKNGPQRASTQCDGCGLRGVFWGSEFSGPSESSELKSTFLPTFTAGKLRTPITVLGRHVSVHGLHKAR